MTSDHWSNLLDPRIKQAFFIGFSGDDRRASMIDRIFNRQSSSTVDERAFAIGGIPSTGWNFEDSGRTQYTEPMQGYLKTFAHHEFARGVMVKRDLIDDNLVPQALNAAGNLGDSAFRVREKAAANVFINAFSAATSETLDDYGTDAVGSDSVALCSTAHNTSASDTTDLTNEGTLALSAANLSTTRQLHMALTDMNGDLLSVMPDELLVPPELEDTALIAVRSTQDPNSANNAINPQAGRFQVVTWHYLTDANSWFLLDSGLRRRSLLWFDRIPLEVQGPDWDRDTQTAKWLAYMRFSLGWTDWRFVYGQNPS